MIDGAIVGEKSTSSDPSASGDRTRHSSPTPVPEKRPAENSGKFTDKTWENALHAFATCPLSIQSVGCSRRLYGSRIYGYDLAYGGLTYGVCVVRKTDLAVGRFDFFLDCFAHESVSR